MAALIPCHETPPDAALLDGVRARVGRVLVVDDGMPPGAHEQLLREAAGRGVEVLRLPRNRGKGAAVARGLTALMASGRPPQAVLVLDADGQHPPASIGPLLAAAAHAELVIGDRLGSPADMPWPRRASNRAVSRLLQALAGHPVRDSQCGMRLLRGRALVDVPFGEGGYEAETRHLKRCLQAGVTVAWVPIPAIYGGRRSSFRPVRDSARVLRAALG